jgi:GNAT superfamily N-acetyltransferase
MPVLEVSQLFLRLDYRGSGAGRALLAAAARWAWEQGVHPVLRVSDHLGEALLLNEHSGWRLLGSMNSRLSSDTLLVLAAPPRSL